MTKYLIMVVLMGSLILPVLAQAADDQKEDCHCQKCEEGARDATLAY